MSRSLCLVCGSQDDEVQKMHYFPRQLKKSKKWQEAMGMKYCGDSLKNHRICSRHFIAEDYLNNIDYKLRVDAVPSYFPCYPLEPSLETEHHVINKLAPMIDPLELSNENVSSQKPADNVLSGSTGTTSIDLPKNPKHNVSDITMPPPQIDHEVSIVRTSSLLPIPQINTSAQKRKDVQVKKTTEKVQITYNILLDELSKGKPRDKDDDISFVESPKVVIDLCDDETNDIPFQSSPANSSGCTISKDEATYSKKDAFFLTPQNMANVCRICLKEKEVLHMSENKHEEHTYAEILEICSTIKLKEEPSFSPYICQGCLDELLQANNFRQKCARSEQTLLSFKSELEKIDQRNMCHTERQKNLTLRFHDYENILKEEDVHNITSQKRHVEDPVYVDDNDNAQRHCKKRFYLLKGKISGTEGFKGNVNVTEIDETNAKTLMCDSHQTALSLQVGNAICNIKTAVVKPEKDNGKDGADVPKNSILIKSHNKRRIIPYSMLLRPAINSILSGRITNLNTRILRKKKPPRKRKRNTDKVPKIKDKKPTIPGTCHICNEPYNTLLEYKQHSNVTRHYLNPYVCDSCGKIYSDRHRLKMHKTTSHENHKSHMCEVCGKCFKTRSYLFIHLKTHRQKKRIACRVCGKTFLTRREIVHHRRINHPSVEKHHCCEFCGEFFARPDTLRHHRNRVHLQIKHQFCQICGKGYQYKSSLKKHMITHSTQLIDCKLCNKSFKAEHRYLQHMKNQHPGATEDSKEDDEMRNMECDYCDRVCRNKQSQTMHVKEDHEGNICLYCDTLFETPEELQNHTQELHPDIPDFSCRYCGKCFTECPSLYAHLDTHKPKYYQCNLCYKKFASTMRLKIHMVIHTREKMFECSFCEKTFLYSTSRVIHERIHTGERPYVCDICGKANICISSYKRHRRTHIMPVHSDENEESEAVASIEVKAD